MKTFLIIKLKGTLCIFNLVFETKFRGHLKINLIFKKYTDLYLTPEMKRTVNFMFSYVFMLWSIVTIRGNFKVKMKFSIYTL